MATEPKPDERPLRADARRNRERILEAARYACAEHGASVQIDDVARGAGVGVGTVYRHFPTKDLLIEALVAEKFRITTREHPPGARDRGPVGGVRARACAATPRSWRPTPGLRDALVRIGPDVVHAGEARAELDAARGPSSSTARRRPASCAPT